MTLPRRRPMRRSGQGLQPKTPAPQKKRPKPKRSRAGSDRYAELRVQVKARAQDRCERCGCALGCDWECHHRRLRSQGGRDAVENLVAICPGCHRWAHANPTKARADGWIVPGLGSGPRVHPEAVPIRLHDGRVVRLTTEDDGTTYDTIFDAPGGAA